MIHISPSLLSADMSRLAEAVDIIVDAADYVHCDVMDGHFVPNLTFGAPVVAAVKSASILPLDVHLMIEAPGRWINDYIRSGLDENDFLTFHVETEAESEEVIERIRASGVRPGIAVKPGTGFEEFKHLIGIVDQVLIMTVEPGFSGQSFMRDRLEKVTLTRSISSLAVIGVDGGIDAETAPEAVRAGANLLVAGTAVYGGNNPIEAIRRLRASVTTM